MSVDPRLPINSSSASPFGNHKFVVICESVFVLHIHSFVLFSAPHMISYFSFSGLGLV